MNWDEKRIRLKQRMKAQHKNFRKRLDMLQSFVSQYLERTNPVGVWSGVYIFYSRYMKAKKDYEDHISGH